MYKVLSSDHRGNRGLVGRDADERRRFRADWQHRRRPGLVGAVVGGFLFGLLGISAGGLIGSIVTATVGAAVLLFVVGLIKKS
jgi:hypothetical protein